eukprot:TRINITY_DN17442_c1_g1_i2.p1 TRINITY_DN17442_c1_g1~~TRINITY_DN17442_c1_g1_i2.p1  ORF type:complete len:240 (-),score=58.20 TRINITY_DN17442_c1_g1_i2:101-820(-)
MVSDFDLAAYREGLGLEPLPAPKSLEEAYLQSVARDLMAAPELMLRLATTVARAYGLRMDDWADENQVCTEAVRVVPCCYHLRRQLPGGLNSARALRFLAPGEDEEAASKKNPWKSDDAKVAFEEAHAIRWLEVENLAADDASVASCFSGSFRVVDVCEVEEAGIVMVTLEALRLAPPPCEDFGAKDLSPGDTIFWELEKGLAPALRKGIVIQADWYETQNGTCFLSAVSNVVPEWILV